ncbi:putative Transposon TX1 [Gossypium australe]|uniref:Putative Transposon TX1 n=1 Tax=Gossypium australe TaxID=47621 RepID=A0A5B6WCE7_9ROSI|nr:putative Transposon TX1 [Gossypium australe]
MVLLLLNDFNAILSPNEKIEGRPIVFELLTVSKTLDSRVRNLLREGGQTKQVLAHRIGKVQVALDRKYSRFLLELELELRVEYEKTLDDEESLWRQKSGVEWIQQGDRNTKYFHTKILRRRKFNKIFALKVDGEWCFDDGVLQREMILFSKTLYSLNDQRHVLFPLHGLFPRIDSVGL